VTDFNGFGAITGSVDEFRFWKTARTTEDISKNWFTQVYGGTNTDDANTDLGAYLKFNSTEAMPFGIHQSVRQQFAAQAVSSIVRQ
jgi:hypothetical protein